MYTEGEWEVTGNSIYARPSELEPEIICYVQGQNKEANAQLIASAVNACIKLNPDNPLAVAQSITDLYEALTIARVRLLEAGFNPKNGTIAMIDRVIAKAER